MSHFWIIYTLVGCGYIGMALVVSHYSDKASKLDVELRIQSLGKEDWAVLQRAYWQVERDLAVATDPGEVRRLTELSLHLKAIADKRDREFEAEPETVPVAQPQT